MPNWKKVIVSGSDAILNNITVSGNVSGSATSTASFGHYIGIPSSNPFPFTGDAQISGSLIISQSYTAGDTDSTALRLFGSGSVSQSGIFEVEGSAGPLFSVADGLDGVLMEVNNISGLPLFQVSSSNEVFINRGNLTSGVNTATASFANFSGSFQGDGTNLNLANNTTISSGTNLTQSIFVTQNGNDTTAVVGNMSKPFATLESASQAATIGSTIFVYPGTYTPTENLAREGANYYFSPGTTVSSSYAGAIFDVEGFRTSPHGFNVYGNADFHFHTSTAASLWEAGANNAEVTFNWTLEFQDVTTTSDATDTIIRLGGTGQTSRIKFRDATIQGTFIANDASYQDSQKIKIEGNTFTSTNGGFYSQGTNTGPAYMQVDMAYVYAGGSAHAFTGLGYNVGLLFNIAYCYGPSGAYHFSPTGGSNQNTVINGYANEINITGPADITHNGDCDNLVMSNGRYVGKSVKVASITGGKSKFNTNFQGDTGTISISDGVHQITVVESSVTYFGSFSISGGKLILDGYNPGAYSNYKITVSGGELIYKAYSEYATNILGGGRQPFNVTGGLLRMQGYASNRLTDSDGSPKEYSVIKYTGGDIILDGATLVVSSSIAPPIWASDQTREVKIYSGGVNTNKTGSMGLLAASSSFGSGGYALTNPLGGMIIEDASVE
jgi:hypothetical protein